MIITHATTSALSTLVHLDALNTKHLARVQVARDVSRCEDGWSVSVTRWQGGAVLEHTVTSHPSREVAARRASRTAIALMGRASELEEHHSRMAAELEWSAAENALQARRKREAVARLHAAGYRESARPLIADAERLEQTAARRSFTASARRRASRRLDQIGGSDG